MDTIIEMKDLTKIFRTRRAELVAVDHINFDIYNIEIFGMIWPNGAWKSTTFAMMTTLIKPTMESIKVSGFDVEKDGGKITRTDGNLLPGVEDIIEITIKNIGEEEAKDAIAIINPSDPISTKDDNTYLGSIEPGGSIIAKYRIKADSKAVSKFYSKAVRYETPEGDIKYSSNLQPPVEVKETGFFQGYFGWA